MVTMTEKEHKFNLVSTRRYPQIHSRFESARDPRCRGVTPSAGIGASLRTHAGTYAVQSMDLEGRTDVKVEIVV